MEKSIIPKILLIGAVIIFISFNSKQQAHAIHFSGYAPQFSLGGDPADGASLNYELVTAFQSAIDEVNDEVEKYQKQSKMAGAFGDAAAFSSHAAELWGYQGYDKIALLAGVSATAQTPGISFDMSFIENALNDISDKGDAQIGICLSGAINLGLHLGWLSPKARDWYINVKFFMYDLDIPLSGYTLSYETMTIGVGANYQLVRARKLGKNLVLWRGLSIGTGLLVQQSSLDFEVDIDQETTELGGAFAGMGFGVKLTPEAKLSLSMTTYTIPIDIVTSIRLLYFLNISLGAGIDFNFGTSEVMVQGGGNVSVTGNPDPLLYGTVSEGFVEDKTTTEGEPFVIGGRIMAGIGITAAPAVLLDANMVYYITDGFGINLSIGFAW